MPNYVFECEKCSQSFEEFKTIAEMDIPLDEGCPFCGKKGHIIRIVGSTLYVDPIRLEASKGRLKPSNDFTEVMTRIKKNHPAANFEVR